ncbi:hypothetical protein JTB14_005212 [Gonioctena quinquepunctata]|nr:hypothetical protein JTB14_005212 [Gonioctena quinquepunctata]
MQAQGNRSRGFRGNRGRNNNDRKPWTTNFNNRGRGNGPRPSPWLNNPDPFDGHHGQSLGNQASLMSVFADRGQQGMGNAPQWGNQNVNGFTTGPNYRNENHNRGGLNFIPPESDGSYWRDCPNPYSHKNEGEPPRQQQATFNRDKGHQNNFRKQFTQRFPYNKSQQRGGRNRPNQHRWGTNDQHAVHDEPEPDLQPELTPLEARVEKLINAVKSQPHGVGEIVLLQNNNEIPPVLLNNAVHQVKNCVLAIDRDEASGHSKLKINGLVITEGMYCSKKDAKEALYEMGLEILKSKCFYVTSKSHFEEVSMDTLAGKPKEEEPVTSTLEGSKAHQMMLKMGWGGKGLGTKEQGEEKSVADKIVENITREGLGSQNVMQEVHKILYDYARSNKTTTLGFDSGFTKEERAQIHNMAAKFHLKSKSEGGFNLRRITVSKKISKLMLVRELLMAGGENESYVLTLPDDYQEMWKELCEKDGVEV